MTKEANAARRSRLKKEELIKDLANKLEGNKQADRPFVWKEFVANHTGLQRKVYKVNGKEVLLRARQVYKYKDYNVPVEPSAEPQE